MDSLGCTRQSSLPGSTQQVPGVETLADMHPKIADLMHDGSDDLSDGC